MPRLSIWNGGRKGNDYKFLDKTIAEYFQVGGTAAYVHKYLGTYDKDGNPDLGGELTIQDVLFMENRDRRYAEDVLELRGIYNVQDVDLNLMQFGIFLSNDDLFIEFHQNDMISIVGRKLMNGDVIELPHLREDAFLDSSLSASNKYYVVTDGNRSSTGYSQTWFPHVWRVKCSPITDSQEYSGVFKKPLKDVFGLTTTETLTDIISSIGKEQNLNAKIVEEAKVHVAARNFETRQFYVVPGDELGTQFPWIFAGDGVPPNGATIVGSGSSYPLTAVDGDYYLRTDYEPHVLFKKIGPKWTKQELDYRKQDWSMAHRLMMSFVNNTNTTTLDDGTTTPEKQALSKALKPKADF